MADQEQYVYYRLPDSDKRHKSQGERVSVVKYVQKDPTRPKFKKRFREQKAFREKVGYRAQFDGTVRGRFNAPHDVILRENVSRR